MTGALHFSPQVYRRVLEHDIFGGDIFTVTEEITEWTGFKLMDLILDVMCLITSLFTALSRFSKMHIMCSSMMYPSAIFLFFEHEEKKKPLIEVMIE